MPFMFHDIISPDITLYFNHSKKHTSFISKLLTLLTVISGIILSDFFSKKKS